jgi:hypothetical protein
VEHPLLKRRGRGCPRLRVAKGEDVEGELMRDTFRWGAQCVSASMAGMEEHKQRDTKTHICGNVTLRRSSACKMSGQV